MKIYRNVYSLKERDFQIDITHDGGFYLIHFNRLDKEEVTGKALTLEKALEISESMKNTANKKKFKLMYRQRKKGKIVVIIKIGNKFTLSFYVLHTMNSYCYYNKTSEDYVNLFFEAQDFLEDESEKLKNRIQEFKRGVEYNQLARRWGKNARSFPKSGWQD